MKTTLHTLPNTLRVVHVDTGNTASCTALLMVGTGSRYEHSANNGIAHFFEHMAFKGSARYPDAMRLAATVEGFGGVFNAFTSKEYTGYWIKGPVSHVSTMIQVIADMVQHPMLLPEEIEREKGVIIEEIHMYEDTPQSKVGDIYEQILFAGNSLGMDTIGTTQTVSSATRTTFLNFIQSFYTPGNSLLVVAGGAQPDIVESVAGESFQEWEDHEVPAYSRFSPPQRDTHRHIYRKQTEQAHLVTGFRTFGIDDAGNKRYILSVLSAVLGGGMSSRLFHELRERRGLCYYVSASSDLYHDVGTYYVRAGLPVDEEKVKEAQKVITEEEEKITQHLVGSEELARAKELIKGHFLLSLEDTFDVAYFMGRKMLLEGVQGNPDALVKAIDAVTATQVRELAQEIFSTSRFTAMVSGKR